MSTAATPAPPPNIRELEDIRAGDLDCTDLLTILHWRMLNTTAAQFIDHADAMTKLEQLTAALQKH